jgi:HAE1 family hydrophobic/amphiphilic exporter-1
LTVSPGEFTFKLKPDQLAMNGLNSAEVASTLRLALFGLEVTELIKDDEEIVVWAQFDEEKIPTINALENLTLVNNMGGKYRLGDVADIELGSSLSVINRLDQKRVVAVTAAVEAPSLPNEVLVEFQEKAGQLDLPSDIEIKYGGQNETNEESIISILYAMILSMFLIISILVIQYNSFGKAVLVLATIPLAITGVFYGLWITGFTLSFPALIGILALFGIVVKNALILVDKINLNQKIGIEFVESIVDAAKSRLEAIYLTTFSTVIGMIPLAIGDSTWSDVAVALIFGLAVSTFLTLFVIPILYHLLFRREAAKEAKLRELRAVYESRD